MPKVSIIVPIYNIEDYIERCLESLLSQTLKNIEIICVDDGSTDSSGDICDYYALQDERLVVIHKENGGLVSARKIGLEIARGEYIGFVDGDDYIEPDMYQQLLAAIQQNHVDIIHSGFISQGKTFLPKKFEVLNYMDARCENIRKYVLSSEITPSIWSKLFKKEIIQNCYSSVPDIQSYGEDLVCLVNCFCEGAHMISIDMAFYHYTIRDDSISHLISNKNYQEEINLYESIVNNLENYGLLEELQAEMTGFLQYHMITLFSRSLKKDFVFQRYSYKGIDKIRKKKVVIFGAGQVGRDYYSEISRDSECEIVAWVDNNYKNFNYHCRKVESVQILFNIKYDYIIVAVLDKIKADEIRLNLIHQNISNEKIIWEEPQRVY